MPIVSSLTVFFEDPFWVGVYERADSGAFEICRVVFGAEPKDYDVYAFTLKNLDRLAFSPPVARKAEKTRAASPKRVRREIARQLSQRGIGTKAQQALQMQREACKQARAQMSREKLEEEKRRLFRQKQQRKKEKHRGR